jgi:aminomethyltransferase
VTTSTKHDSLRRTPLYDEHRALGGKLIDFGGWAMPVQYKPGIIKEHTAVREAAGLFDVSHMGEAVLRGPGAGAAVQRLITNDASKLGDGRAMYTVMCMPSGGIVDDCIVYRRSEREYWIVLNASNSAKDLAWLREHAGADVEIEDRSDETALIAIQGPRAVAIADGLAAADLASVPKFSFADVELAGVPCMAARTGYTGEDGFELACPADRAVELRRALLEAGAGEGLVPVGLGARDTLRLEARLLLYGNDIDEQTTPYEAALGWVVKLDKGEFIGREALAAQKAEGPARKLAGFKVAGRSIPRAGYAIVDRERAEGDQVIGEVTSGGPGISVGGPIGLGYVPAAYARPGRAITIDCRGKDIPAEVVKGPFYRAS